MKPLSRVIAEQAAAVVLLFAWLASPARSDEKPHELCAVCHGETVQDSLTHPHAQKGFDCDTCHGASVKHSTSQGHAEPDRIAAPHEIPALCGDCHKGTGVASVLAQYSESRHGKLVLAKAKVRAPHCGTCHGVHNVRTGQAMENQCRRCHSQLPASCSSSDTVVSSKPVVSCVRCHVPHGFRKKEK
jgi:Cytochrome c7 and related cytochrome c